MSRYPNLESLALSFWSNSLFPSLCAQARRSGLRVQDHHKASVSRFPSLRRAVGNGNEFQIQAPFTERGAVPTVNPPSTLKGPYMKTSPPCLTSFFADLLHQILWSRAHLDPNNSTAASQGGPPPHHPKPTKTSKHQSTRRKRPLPQTRSKRPQPQTMHPGLAGGRGWGADLKNPTVASQGDMCVRLMVYMTEYSEPRGS